MGNLAYRFGIQQSEKLRAADDLKRSCTDTATLIKTRINLPFGGRIAHMCSFFRSEGETRPLALAKADCAEAYEQSPLTGEDELVAVLTLRGSQDNN